MTQLQLACKQVSIISYGQADFHDEPNGCWGAMKKIFGCCLGKRRKGKLTCSKHNAAEYDAQRLHRTREAEIRKWEIDL